ncbi:8-amino-7-oxononanoate synthase [Azonexus sp.]|uniref:8-amino-7-oxononanoate synthase n=1 Tax=Azonexus sp. TaxID=1872668 RepID=UPI0039E61B60
MSNKALTKIKPDAPPLHAVLQGELDALAAAGLQRRHRILQSPGGREIEVDGRKLINFASNDYLGLAQHPALVAAMADGAQRWGAGSGAAHLLSGHLAPHAELEAALAHFTGFPRALTFSSGYLANLAVTPTLAGRGAAVFADKLNHASLIDAMQLAKTQGATVQRYPHADLATLERLLAASTAQRKLIVTDSIFSMDGDLAPLPALLALARQYEAFLIVDDAHGFGVLGPQGRGALAHFALPADPRLILMGTLGKAAGVGGAFVAASEEVIETLISRARSYIFTTASPPALACALCESLRLIEQGDALRSALFARIQELRDGLRELLDASAKTCAWQLPASLSAIQPLIVGRNEDALHLAQALWDKGYWVPAIRPPTVPQGSARLRISLSAAHTAADITGLLAALQALAQRGM